MSLYARLRSWLTALVRRDTLEREMDEELRFHIDTYAADLMREGFSRDEAQRRARAEFGGVALRKDECREARGLRLADEVSADARYALRQLRRAPVFTLVAVLSLGLGIGANTTIFSLMEQAVWKAMPVQDPQQLRLFTWVSGPTNVMSSESGDWEGGTWGKDGLHETSVSTAVYQAWQQRASSFARVFGLKPIGRLTAIIDGQAELIAGTLVTGSFFDGLGIVPLLGRTIIPADDVQNGELIGVISDGFWARRFGRDPAIVGRQLEINQLAVTIVGVTPPGFTGVESGRSVDLFLPLMTQPRIAPVRWGKNPSMVDNPDFWFMTVLGRLKPGVSDAQAQSETQLILQQTILATLPADRAKRDQPYMRLLNGSRGLDNLRGKFSKPLFILSGFVALVLLIACANVANLLLARAAVRRREMSLRLSLGAGRARIARQLLTEGLILGLGGGLAGLAFAYVARDVIPSLLVDPWISDRLTASFDARVLLLTVTVTVFTSVLFSLAPMWDTARADLNTALKDAGTRTTVGMASTLRAKALIVVQVGLSVLLLIAAGLFVRTLANLQAVDLGFTPERLLLFSIDPPRNRYKGAERPALFERLREGIAAIPGIEEATLTDSPPTNNNRSRTGITPDGNAAKPTESAWVAAVGYRFFEAMRIPIIAGRSFDAHDRKDTPPVAVVTQQFARTFYPGVANPVDRTFRNGDRVYHIIGIAGDTHFDNTRSPLRPTYYPLVVQNADAGGMTFELRTSVATGTIMRSVREAVAAVDKDLPIFDVRTQVQQIDATMANERLFATLTAAFGVLALVLACIGIYGVMAHNVSRRTGEIGIRMALGAQRFDVLLMILREASWLTTMGVALGAIASVWLARYLKAMLFGIEPADPATIGGAIGIMLAVALFAGWLPARRAAHVDPMVALRNE